MWACLIGAILLIIAVLVFTRVRDYELFVNFGISEKDDTEIIIPSTVQYPIEKAYDSRA